MYGADSDELDRLAGECRAVADDLDREAGVLSGFLNNVSWLGDVAIRFHNRWSGTSIPQIGLSTRFLREAADELTRHAAQQRDVSRADGGGATGALVCVVPGDTASARAAVDRIRGLLDTGGWGVTGSDLDKILDEFAALSPAERSAVFARLTDEELRVLKDQMQESPKRGGWHAHEQAKLLGLLLPALSPEEARRLMGPEWAVVIDDRLTDGGAPLPRQESFSQFAAELVGTTGNEGVIPADQIQIRKVGPNEYIVVMPGVTDLTRGLQEGGAVGVANGLAGAAAVGAEWVGTNDSNSARDMHYAAQSEMAWHNGSETGSNGYALAVKHAMIAAGVPEHANVMLVGHSFGAYTAGELATDRTFNDQLGGSGYSVNVTHVLGAGASAAFRFNELPAGTQGLLINNSGDAAYQGELLIGTNNESSSNEVVFNGGREGLGHHPTNYRDFLASTQHPAVTAFSESAHTTYGGAGTHTRVHVEDPYRIPTN